MATGKNAELVAGLHSLCAFIEANDDFQFNLGDSDQIIFHWREWYIHDKPAEERRAMIADLAKRLGKSEKQYADNFFWLRHDFGKGVRFEVSSMREVVCERVVVGTRTEPARPEITLPATEEKEIEIVEWRCEPILAEESA